VDSVDDVLSSGDLIDVTVVEVDKERGRIGLRLTEDPSVAGKSPEELATVGSGDGGRRGGGDRGGRGRDRDRGGRGGRERERRN
jgi:polyribonucleotide nucleotidyltransferase